MRFPCLPLQTVLLLLIVTMAMLRLMAVADMLLDVLLALLDLLLVHFIEEPQTQFDIREQLVAPTLAEILAHHYPQHLQVVGVRRHGVRRDDPSALAELMREGEFVEVFVRGFVKTECDEWEPIAGFPRHDDEPELFQGVGEVVGGARQVGHDAAVAVLAEADQLVVLADDLGGALGEVEGEGGLVCAEVVDIEDKLLGEVFWGAPDDPAYAGVDEAVPV